MLQEFRKLTQGWVATVLGGILCIAFLLWGIENYLGNGPQKNVAAKVNGVEITAAQINADYQRLLANVKDHLGSSFALTPVLQEQMKKQTLNNLVIQTALTQAAAKAGFSITAYQAASVIKQMPEFQENGVFSKPRFERIMARLGFTQPEFIADMTQSLMLNQVATGIIGTQFVLPNELTNANALMSQKRDFTYTIIPSSQYRKEISADLLKQYYEQHKQDFKAPAKMRIEYIELSLAASAKNMTVSQHELNDYFGSNGNLAKNDPKVIAKAKETLLQQKAEQAFLAASDKLADLTYTDPNSLTQAANALGLTIATTDYFTQAGGTTPLTKNPKIIATVYNPDFIKNNVNSNLIELAPGVVAVVRLKDYQADSVLPLPAVQNKIKQQLIAANATIAAKQQGEALLMSIKGGDDFAKQVSRVKGLTIATKIQVSRKQADLSPELLSLAFSIGPQAKTKLVGAQLTNGDYAIVLLKNTQAQSQIKSDSKMNVEKTYPENYGKVDYQFYTANQIEQSKIKTYSK